MATAWYKDELEKLKKADNLKDIAKYWKKNLFSAFTEIPRSIDDSFVNIAVTMGTFKRLQETVLLWGDENKISATERAIFFSSLYLCLVYPKQGFLEDLYKNLPEKSDEKRILEYLTSSDSDTRHIRNSLSHGTFEFSENEVKFKDTNPHNNQTWEKSFVYPELRFLILLVVDVFMTCFEKSMAKSVKSV